MPERVISIRQFGGMVTNPEGEDIPDNMAEWARDTDPNYKGKLKGIPVNGSAVTAAGLALPDIYEGDWLGYEISGVSLRDLVYIDKEDGDITVIGDFYNANPLTILSATEATPIVCTVAAGGHHLNYVNAATDVGQKVTISGGTGMTAINGNHWVKWVSDTTFGLYSDEALTTGVASNGAYDASTATVTKPTFFDLLPAPGATPTSCKTFAGQVQIGVGTTKYPRAVYRLTEAKTFFNTGMTARRGLYATRGICSTAVSSQYSQCLVSSSTLSGAAAGYFQNGVYYAWTVSIVFNGIQESPLYGTQSGDIAVATDDTCAVVIDYKDVATYFDTGTWDKRVTAVKLYRAESSDGTVENLGLYRLVATIDIQSGTDAANWAASGTDYRITYTDTGGYPEGGATYEEETGIAETLVNSFIYYTNNQVGGGYHWIYNAYVPIASAKKADWSRYIFRSQKFRPNMFDWTKNTLPLPEIPTALAYFNNKLYAFSENNTYRINPELLVVEDTFEGVGCSNPQAVTVTEFGMFFCNRQGAYRLMNNTMDVISDDIRVDGDVTLNVGWKSFAVDTLDNANKLGRFITLYDANMRMVLFIGNSYGSAVFTAMAFHLPTQGWREITCALPGGALSLDTNSGAFTGKDGEIYFSGDDALTPLMTGATSTAFDWVSKLFHLNEPSQKKSWKKIIWDVGAGAITNVYYAVDGAKVTTPGSTATSGNNINVYNKTFQVYVDGAAASEVDSLDIVVRPLRGKR